MLPEPGDLLIFARVVEAGSFSRAAERLGLPKSTVSRRVAALEATLGQRLLQRTTRKLAVTEFGSALLGPARQVVNETEQAAALAESSGGQAAGRLRVSMPADLGAALAPAIARFIADHRAVRVDIDLSPRRVDLIAEGFDIAIRTGALADDPYLAARRLADLGAGLYAAPGYLQQAGTPRKPEELSAHTALHLSTRDGEPAPWTLKSERTDESWSGVLTRRATANAYDVLVRLAVEGAGIAALPDLFAASHVRAGTLAAVMPKWRMRASAVWAVFPSRKFVPVKTRAFADTLAKALAGAR